MISPHSPVLRLQEMWMIVKLASLTSLRFLIRYIASAPDIFCIIAFILIGAKERSLRRRRGKDKIS
jgi:hypothetical protein